LELTAAVDKAEVERGETLSYTLTVKNTGDVSTTTTFLVIDQPNLADYVAGSGTYTRTSTGATNNLPDAWVADGANFGTVPAGTNVVVHYKTTVAQNANHDDILWSNAVVDSDQTGRVQGNVWSRVVFKNPGICAEKTADKTSVTVGDTVNFTIKVCNSGNIVLHNIYIGDIIHSPLKYVPGSTVLSVEGESDVAIADSWLNTGANIGPLNPGQDAFLRFKVTVTDALKDGETIQNVAQVKSDETPNILQCAVVLKGKVLGIVVTPPTVEKPKVPELPNTGPGEVFLLISGMVPAGWMIKKFKSKI
jgi:uncharacterized repeat protein (TIGR01451 family)